MEGINIYPIIFIILIFLSLFSKLFPFKKRSRIFLVLSFLTLFLILAIRVPYAADMPLYLGVFNRINVHNMFTLYTYDWEKLYVALCAVIKLFTSSERMFMIIISFLGLLGPYKLLKRYSNNYFFSIIFLIVLGIYHYNFYILRQSLAISFILFFGIKYIEDKSFFKFLIVVIIASFIHFTSISFILAYPICNIKFNKFWLGIYSIFCVIVFVLKKQLVRFLLVFKYTQYVDSFKYGEGYGRLLLYIGILIFTCMISYPSDKTNNSRNLCIREKKDINTIFFNMMLIAIFFQIFSLEIPTLTRITSYFAAGAVVLLPNYIYKIKNEKTKMLFCAIILVTCFLYSIYISPSPLYEVEKNLFSL